MYNKKILLEAIKNLEKAKAPARKKDITFDPTGKGMLNPIYAGKPVVLPTDTLYNPTPYPIKATSDNGIQKFLNPFDETNVHFPGASSIKEEPLMKKGGSKKQSKSLSATNKLLKKNPLFKKKNYKGKTYDPSAMYFQDGGFIPYDYNPYVSAEAPMEDIPFVNPIITGTEPEDYQAFLDYSRTAPENRRPNENYFYGDPDNYDHYGMWEALGKPRNFQEALDMNPDWEPDPYDKMYHGFSVNPETGVFLKSGKPGDTKEGDTTWMEIAGHYLSPRANESTPVFDPELQRFKYIPNPSFQKGGQMSKEEFAKRKAAYKKLTGRDFEPPKTFKPSEKARQQYQEKYNQQPTVQQQASETIQQSTGLPIEEVTRRGQAQQIRESEKENAKVAYLDRAATNYMKYHNETYGSEYGFKTYEQALQEVSNPEFGGLEKYYNMYNPGPKNEELSAYEEQGMASRTWDVITNPFTAFKYSVQTGDFRNMPQYINEARMAGYDVDPDNLVGNAINTFANPFDVTDKVVRNTAKGNFKQAGLEALRMAPIPLAKYVPTVLRGANKFLSYAPIKQLPWLTGHNAINAHFAYETFKPEGFLDKSYEGFKEEDYGKGFENALLGSLGIAPFIRPGMQTIKAVNELRTPGSFSFIPGAGKYSLAYKSPMESGLLVGNPNLGEAAPAFEKIVNPLSRFTKEAGLGEFRILKQNQAVSNVKPNALLGDMTRAGQAVEVTTPALMENVPRQLPGFGNADELVDLWRIQEKGARPMAELAAEGKLGSMFQNEKAIQHFKDREKYFGQWFTKDKADFDFYKADREFVNPKIIHLQVPKSRLAEFQNYDKSLSIAADREFVIPLEQQKLFTPKQLPGFGKTNPISQTSGMSAYTDEVAAFSKNDNELAANIIDDIRNRKLELWKTPEGKRRLQKMIDNTPALKGQTPESLSEAMEQVTNVNRTYSDKLKALDDIDSKKRQIEIAYDEGYLSVADYKIEINELDQKERILISNLKDIEIALKQYSGAFDLNTRTFEQGVRIQPGAFPLKELPLVTSHELAHFLSSFKKVTPTYIDKQLEGLQLITDFSKQIKIPFAKTTPEKSSAYTVLKADKEDYLKEAVKYWNKGSKGTEKTSFLAEVREDMLQKGIIKSEYQPITNRMLKAHYENYKKAGDSKFPLRVYDIMQNKSENFNLLEKVINNLPIVIGGALAADSFMDENNSGLSEASVSALFAFLLKKPATFKIPKQIKTAFEAFSKGGLEALKPGQIKALKKEIDALYTLPKAKNIKEAFSKKTTIPDDVLQAYNKAKELQKQGYISKKLPDTPEDFDKWLKSQYNQKPLYRVVDVNPQVINDNLVRREMQKQGLNPDNPYHVAEYMGTTTAPTDLINRGRRSGGHDELLRGSDKDILYFAEDPRWIGPRYGGGNPYYVKTFADPLPEGLHNQVLRLRDNSQLRKNYTRDFPGFNISNIPSGVLFEDGWLRVGNNMVTPIIGNKGEKLRKAVKVLSGDEFNKLSNPFFQQGGPIQPLDYFDTELTDEEIEQYLQGGEYLKLQQGGTPSEIWKQHTGTSWSEAKRQGLKDGSAAQNIALANRVLAGEFGESQVSYEDYQNSRAAYDQMVVDKVMRGATLDDLVTQRVGTRSGLINRFPDLFNQQSPQQPKTLPDKPSAKKENIQRNSPASVKETPVITRPVVKPQQQTPLNINELREKIKELKRKNQTQGPTAFV